MAEYTAISFAPVQGFIEKSRKLRDLYGASQILSYLSWKIVCSAKSKGFDVISPAIADTGVYDISSADIVQGMPNRILIKGDFSSNDAQQTLMVGWKEIIEACRRWLKDNEDLKIIDDSGWANSWTRWKIHAWEVFWGSGDSIEIAMRDLETRKLRRGWTVSNWNGESSSLSGYDAIAYPNMDRQITRESRQNQQELTEEIKAFYKAIAKKLDPHGNENDRAYINENERLSIPELIKRLVTYPDVRDSIDYYRAIPSGDKKAFEIESFAKLMRKNEEKQETYWTGWFMGDGDRIGNYLNSLSDGESVKNFSSCLRDWGHDFKRDFELGRVVYAGGDDFLGVIYGTDDKPQRDKQEVVDWLCGLRAQWERLRENMRNKGLRVNDGDEPDVSLSVGFVWAGHSVPQRDVLQHCREAEKLAKSLGRDRITIRVVFNNGQFVQWTTPWEYLKWLGDYCDRDRNDKRGKDANWNHVYTDLAQLKARHAIPPANAVKQNEAIALELLKLYFGKDKGDILSRDRQTITGDKNETAKSVIEWIEGMIQIGWYLCSDS